MESFKEVHQQFMECLKINIQDKEVQVVFLRSEEEHVPGQDAIVSVCPSFYDPNLHYVGYEVKIHGRMVEEVEQIMLCLCEKIKRCNASEVNIEFMKEFWAYETTAGGRYRKAETTIRFRYK